MRDFNNRFLFVVVVVVVIIIVVILIFFFFSSINASDIIVKYDKNENKESKSETDIIYYNY